MEFSLGCKKLSPPPEYNISPLEMGTKFRWDGIKCPGSRVSNLPGLEFLFHPVGKCLHLGFTRTPVVRTSRIFWFQKFSTPKKKQGGRRFDSPTWTNALLFFLTWGIVVTNPPLTVYIPEKGNGRNSVQMNFVFIPGKFSSSKCCFWGV